MNKITPKHIESVIDDEAYLVPGKDSLSTLTICILQLKNGFEVIGESACCSREIYNEETGKIEARKKAVDRIWPLEGYLLKERMLYQNSKREPETKAAELDMEDKPIEETEEKTAIKAVTENKEETPEAVEAEPAEEKPGKITEITPTSDVIIESEPEPKIA